MEESNKKIYELGYNVLPTVSEEELAKIVESIKNTLIGMKAEIISDQYPSAITLAYEMVKEIENKNRKFSSAFFGWVKFELEASLLEEFKKSIEKDLNILRFLIIKTVRESTLAVPKLAHKGMPRRIEPETDNSAPMDEVAVDKKIDEMLEDDSLDADLK